MRASRTDQCYLEHSRSSIDDRRLLEFFVDDVELVFAAEDAPDDGNIFDDQWERNDEKRSKYAQDKPHRPKPVDRERLHHAENIHVQVHSLWNKQSQSQLNMINDHDI